MTVCARMAPGTELRLRAGQLAPGDLNQSRRLEGEARVLFEGDRSARLECVRPGLLAGQGFSAFEVLIERAVVELGERNLTNRLAVGLDGASESRGPQRISFRRRKHCEVGDS